MVDYPEYENDMRNLVMEKNLSERLFSEGKLKLNLKVSDVCPTCGAPNDEKRRFCPYCGKELWYDYKLVNSDNEGTEEEDLNRNYGRDLSFAPEDLDMDDLDVIGIIDRKYDDSYGKSHGKIKDVSAEEWGLSELDRSLQTSKKAKKQKKGCFAAFFSVLWKVLLIILIICVGILAYIFLSAFIEAFFGS